MEPHSVKNDLSMYTMIMMRGSRGKMEPHLDLNKVGLEQENSWLYAQIKVDREALRKLLQKPLDIPVLCFQKCKQMYNKPKDTKIMMHTGTGFLSMVH